MPLRLWLILLLFLAACHQSSPPSPTIEPTPSPQPTITPSQTVTLLPTAAATAVIVPASPTPTNTPSPTDTPQPTATQAATATPTVQLTFEQLRNSDYPTTFVESGVVQLTDGAFQQVVSADSPIRTYARISEIHAFGDLNDDGDDDAVVILATNTGGTGVFYELFVVEMIENRPRVITNTYLGDRVVIRALSIEDGMITLDLRQQGHGDALCCPSEEAQFVYALEDEEIVQTAVATATSAEVAIAGDTVNAFMQTYLQDPSGSSSLDFVTAEVQTDIETEGIAQLTGITEPIISYFYAIQQRGATAVRIKATLNQSTVQNIFFDLERVEDSWLIANIDHAQLATDAFGDNPCRLVTTVDSVVYERPRVQSGLFATLSADTSVVINAQTATGWYGFEPGMAQAANTGVFRYRWIPPDESHQLSESCENLPLVVAVQATQCYTMPQMAVVVYADADMTAETVTTLAAGTSFAAVTERVGEWAKVDLMDSSRFLNQVGWISADTLNLNGATCAEIVTE